MTINSSERYRPIGLSLAILAVGVIFGFFPLTPLIEVIIAAVRRPGFIFDSSVIGGSIGVIHIVLAVVTLLICIPAWLGSPRYIRWTLIIMVWLDTAITLYRLALINQPCLQVCVNLTIPDPILYCLGAMTIFVLLYVTWYVNRAPARNFYRG